MIKETPGNELNVKIGSKEEVLWTNVAQESRILIEQSENDLVVQKALLKLAETKIAQEKEKFK